MKMYKSKIGVSAVFVLLSLFACKSSSPERLTSKTSTILSKRTEDLRVLDGFNDTKTQEIKINLRFEDYSGNGVYGLIVSIGDYNKEGTFSRIYTNMTNEEGLLETFLDVPNHFNKLTVRYFYIGETRQFELKKKSEIVESIQLARGDK